MAGEQSYEHLADRGGGDPAPRRIGDDAAFNLHTIGLILMIVGASVLSCPSSSEIRGGGVGGGGGYRRQRRVTRDGAGGYVEESAATR